MEMNKSLKTVFDNEEIDASIISINKNGEKSFFIDITIQSPDGYEYNGTESIGAYPINVNQVATAIMEIWKNYDKEEELTNRIEEMGSNVNQDEEAKIKKDILWIEEKLGSLTEKMCVFFGKTTNAFFKRPPKKAQPKEERV